MKVHSLIQQAVMRYKKAIAKVSGGYTLSSCGCFLFFPSCFPGNAVAAAAASRALCRRTQYGANLEIDAKRSGEKERRPRFFVPSPVQVAHFLRARAGSPPLHVRVCLWPCVLLLLSKKGGERRTAIVVPLFVNPQKFPRLYNSQQQSFFPPFWYFLLLPFSFSPPYSDFVTHWRTNTRFVCALIQL